MARVAVRLACAAATLGALVPLAACSRASANPCEEASPALVAAVESGIHGSALTNVFTVKSNDFKQAYFVAGIVNGQTAVWVSNRLDDSGAILSVNGPANAVSDWGSGAASDAHFSMSDDGASKSAACAQSG